MANLSPEDRDAVIRTVLGEASDQGVAGQAAVANVIRNRQLAGFRPTASGVVFQKGQFEPWMNRASELNAISPESQSYKNAGQIIDQVYSGNYEDPTKGATHFYAPGLQHALGRNDPSWASQYTKTAQIGGHTFYQDPQYADTLGSSPGLKQLPASATPAADPFQSALTDFDTHMKDVVARNQGQAAQSTGAGVGPQQAAGDANPQQALLMSMMQKQPQQPAQAQQANYGGIPSPNYAAAGNTSSGTANLLKLMMNGRQQSNMLALLSGHQGTGTSS